MLLLFKLQPSSDLNVNASTLDSADESVLPHTYEKFLLGTIELWNVHMLWLNVITPQAWLMMRLLQIM